MRICIASSGLGHVARGCEVWANELGHALAARGKDVVLCKGSGIPAADFERVVPCWQRESRKTQTLLKCLPHRVGWRIGLGSAYGVEQTTFAHNLIKLLKREQIDLLHVQDPHVAWLTQRAAHQGRIKTRTVLAHGTEEDYEFQNRIIYLQHIAPWHLAETRQHGYCKPTWTAIPHFADTERFHPGTCAELRRELSIPVDGIVILVVAAIKNKHKRISFLVDEFRRLLNHQPHLPVWLVIAGGWENDTDDIIARSKVVLGERVRFLVRFPQQRIAELYRAADVFTLGSLKEMISIALIEATASGLPCVIHQHPVMQWVVGAGGRATDLTVRGGWASAIAPLLQNRQFREQLGQRARERCVENFCREKVVDRILEYYEFVLNHDKSSWIGPSRSVGACA